MQFMRWLILVLAAAGCLVWERGRLASQSNLGAESPWGGRIEFRPNGYFPEGFPLHGSIKLLSAPVVEMGSRNRHLVAYRVGDLSIEPGMAIEVWKHFTSDGEEFQTADPDKPAWFGVQLPEGVRGETRAFTNWVQRNTPSVFPYRRVARLTVTQGRLTEGDVVRFDLGGARGVRMQHYAENLFNFRFVILKADEVVGYAGDAALNVTGGPLQKLRVVAPAVVKTGEPFAVEVVPLDEWVSPARDGKNLALKIRTQDVLGGSFRWDDSVEHYVTRDVKALRPATLRIEVETEDGRLRAQSNPIWVEEDPLRRIYFGELHQHTYLHDGRGVFEELYSYGRSVGLLDFGALTPHHTFLTGNGPQFYLAGKRFPVDEWPRLQKITRLANGWQGFVSLLGYEYSVATDIGGHHNVFYQSDTARSTMELNPKQPVAPIASMLRTLQLARVPTLVIPHIGGGPPDWSHPTDPRIERLFEIASVHGVFEESWQKHLETGLRLGAIAAGDTHTTSMGIAYPGLIYVNTNGVAGVYAHGKSRAQIWEGLYERRTFAATGNQRILLDFRVNGEPMGGEISSGIDRQARIQARISGTQPLLRIELIKNNRVIEAQAPARRASSLARIVWGDNLYQRRAATGLCAGRLEASAGRLSLVRPINRDQAFEQTWQDGDAIGWRTAAVSNDRDGFLVDISGASGVLRFRLEDRDVMGTLEAEIPLDALRRDRSFKWRKPAPPTVSHPYMKAMGVEPAFTLECELVDEKAPMDASFQFVDCDPPRPGDFYYLRIEQLDANKAWSSPVWVN